MEDFFDRARTGISKTIETIGKKSSLFRASDTTTGIGIMADRQHSLSTARHVMPVGRLRLAWMSAKVGSSTRSASLEIFSVSAT